MAISAVVMGAAGMMLSFLPQEVAGSLGMSEAAAVILQLLGALYLGFAMINWTARANLIGGIYSRPVALGNLAHFVIAALALAKLSFKTPALHYLWVAALIYSAFAVLFAYVFFTTPDLKSKYN